MPSVLQRWTGHLLDALFPRACVRCNRHGSYLCADCLASTATPLRPPWCARCGTPAPAGSACTFCREHPLELERVRSAYAYTGVLRDAVLHYKYQGLRAAGDELARLTSAFIEKTPMPADLLVPVPMHSSRLRERGYNQTEVLARSMQLQAGLLLAPGALRRVRWAGPQARTHDAAERARNLVGAFVADPAIVAGKRVLVLDDVCTTGATLNACARALLAAGATVVLGLTLAREL